MVATGTVTVVYARMTLDREARARIALIVLVMFSVVSAVELAVRSGARLLRRTDLDRVTVQEQRLQTLTPRLSDQHVIGYVSEELSGGNFTNLSSMQDYFITQYSLAPTIVLVGTDHELLLGNFSEELEEIPEIEGFSVIEDAGNGAALYARERR
jgi:hypothetical protein